MSQKNISWFGLTAVLMVVSAAWVVAQEGTQTIAKDDVLTIGSKAPSLDIEHWVQNGNGRFSTVKEFESGKVYVVEFWATWCGPCIASMPHLSETQRKYADKGVTIISVSDEDLETVTEFLKRPYFDDQGNESTYQALTSHYCLTADPDRSTHAAYMEAANQNGIPTAFIVGKTGLIEWVGHPVSMDEPLEKVVEGTWDRDAYLAEFKAQQEIESKINQVFRFLQRGQMDEAIKVLDELVTSVKDEDMKMQIQMLRFQLLMSEKPEEAAKGYAELVQANRENGFALNHLSWTVYESVERGEPISDELKDWAFKAAKWAVEAEPNDGSILDTLAHWQYVHGDLDGAIETQTKALENPGPAAAEIEAFLKKLKEEKERKIRDGK
ncbi:MAG TPA: redoxin domain-containing protein [Pirellulaceae bacterium]|nr:redoxin domain-containing protein [Pirellulaceae bacterium]